MADTAVLIPIYKLALSPLEERTVLNNIFKLNGNHKIFIIGPASIHTGTYHATIDAVEKIIFQDEYFSSLEGYNRLLRSSIFYSSFSTYKFILILQTDAFIFYDNLQEFCIQEFDYWGAPWINYELINNKLLRKVLPFFHKSRHLKIFRRFIGPRYLVGNGGLSLRKVATHVYITEKYKQDIIEFEKNYTSWINHGAGSMAEDIFWCFFVPKMDQDYKIAPWRKALTFSFEMNPIKAFSLNQNKLPFGCHAFEKRSPEFYSKYIDFLPSSNF